MARKSSRTKRVGKGNRKAAKRFKTARKTSQKTGRPQQQTTSPTSTVHPRIKGQTRGDPGPALPEDFHALYDRGFRASRGMTPAAVTPRETSGHRRLAEQIEGLDVYYDQGTQLPNFIVSRQPAARLSRGARHAGGRRHAVHPEPERSLESLTGGCRHHRSGLSEPAKRSTGRCGGKARGRHQSQVTGPLGISF